MMTHTGFQNDYRSTDSTELPMFGHDLRTQEYLAARSRESDQERSHQTLVSEARHARQAGQTTPSMGRRTRLRVGGAFVAIGTAITGQKTVRRS